MKKNRAFLLVILAGILWGTSGIFVHYLAPLGFTSVQMTAMRSGVATIILIGYALLRDRSLFRVRKIELCIFALTAIGLFGTGTCYFYSMQTSSISTAVVLMYTAPIYVMIFSVLFFGERISALKLVSVLCMLVGCALVSGVAGGMKFSYSGIMMGVLSGISYGAYNILTKLSMRRGTKPLSATLYVFLFTAVISFSNCTHSAFFGNIAKAPALSLSLMLGIGVVTFVLPYVFYTLAMRELDATTTSAMGIVEPMSATLFGVMLFGERLDIYSGSGVFLILTAILLLSKDEDNATEGAKPKKQNSGD